MEDFKNNRIGFSSLMQVLGGTEIVGEDGELLVEIIGEDGDF